VEVRALLVSPAEAGDDGSPSTAVGARALLMKAAKRGSQLRDDLRVPAYSNATQGHGGEEERLC
jgi:hypothetical protein